MAAKQSYDRGLCPNTQIRQAAETAIARLAENATCRLQAGKYGKEYWVYSANGNLSRPYLPTLFIDTPAEFRRRWEAVVSAISADNRLILADETEVNCVLYTAIMAYSICFDLWNPGARKTPGTYFEMLIGSIMGTILPNHTRTKFVSLPNQTENVSTDIVFKEGRRNIGLVIPVKITTRERIVQPYAHQRILDSVFGPNQYRSILLCASELQRNGEDDVNEICVPGTIRLFQSHLARMSGIHYLDPPLRYLQDDITELVPVSSIGHLLTNSLPTLL